LRECGKNGENIGRWCECAPAIRVLKTLILTGDDFGLSARVNEAIERCHEGGVLTQASVMVNEPHAAEAAEIARRHPRLRVGLHLTLCAGRASKVSALTDAAGNLEPSPARAGLRYFFSRSLESALAAEIRAQFEKFRSLGFASSHWDGHTHLHLHPTILRLTMPIAREHGFRFIRLVREPWPRALTGHIFAILSARAVPRLRAQGVSFADHVCGLRDTGRMTNARLCRLFARLPDGLSEIYFHPGAEPESLDFTTLRNRIRREGIQLTAASAR
jgi:hopanoid biosynthesis associated protein HpnK